jgi:hypothetical protein
VRVAIILALLAFSGAPPPSAAPSWVGQNAAEGGGATLNFLDATEGSGQANDLWLQMIRKRLPDDLYRAAEAPKPVTAAERAWVDLIQSRASRWKAEIPALAANFAPVPAPESARIVIGNRGGEDAFTHDPTTIGFDAASLHALYGDATLAENEARIDRFFRHEYTHLLQKAWLAKHPYEARTPLQLAALDIWLEGLGNYYSLSARWRTANGEPSDAARRALTTLEPRFVARLSALACASNDASDLLRADLSMGPFEQKWGALPAALWLEAEAARSPAALREFVLAGPDGVWAFAGRHLSAASRAVIAEARAAESLCR